MKSLTPIFSLIIALMAYFFFTQPTLSDVDDIKKNIDDYTHAVDTAKTMNSTLDALIRQKEQYTSAQQEQLNALVPDSVDEVKRLVDLKQLAQDHNMLIGNIAVANSKKSGKGGGEGTKANQTISASSFDSSNISFSLIGTYEQFKGMLYDIERNLVLMEITNIQFSAGQGNLQQFNVTIRLYGLSAPKSK